jgi:hypothetical protein
MGDNGHMTDARKEQDPSKLDTSLGDLEAADPADAPGIAEELAERLARDLDGTGVQRSSGPEDPS